MHNLVQRILEATGEHHVFLLVDRIEHDSFRVIGPIQQILADVLSEAGIVDDHIASLLHDSVLGTARFEGVALDLTRGRNEIVIISDKFHQVVEGDYVSVGIHVVLFHGDVLVGGEGVEGVGGDGGVGSHSSLLLLEVDFGVSIGIVFHSAP